MNTRVLQAPLTGMQRYVLELGNRFGGKIELISPQRSLSRAQGNTWEQFSLPMKLGNSVLFSPANTGPLIVSNQVVTIHDVAQLDRSYVPELNDDIDSKAGAWYRFLTPRLVKRVAHVITISEFSKARILAHARMDERRITVVPNGVDARFRPHKPDEVFEKLKGLHLPSRHYALCVGSLEPRKNLARLLQAWSRIQMRMPNEVWLVLTGKRGNARVFTDAAGLDALPPRVHVTGHVPDDVLPALYGGATVFVFPSVYEGFGLPPLEAMASGVPVLTGNRTSLPEVVGDAALTVDPYDVQAIADGLAKLIDDGDLRDELAKRGRERAARFTWRLAAEKTWQVLTESAN